MSELTITGGNLKIAPVALDPEIFLGAKSWKIVTAEQDSRFAALGEIDFDLINFATALAPGEGLITGEEKLKRLRASGYFCYGASVCGGLLADHQARGKKSVLEVLYRRKKIVYLDFFGDVLWGPDGRRYVLGLYRGAGSWCRQVRWLGDVWGTLLVSAVSPLDPRFA